METSSSFHSLRLNGLRYLLSPFDLEQAHDYEPGGHHPVHLGDTLGSGRFRVIHKLGNGGTGNVWLCRDLHVNTPTYVALKILMADVPKDDCPELVQGGLLKACQTDVGTKDICLFLDHFELDGPNGSHLCFVYPVLGPQVSRGQLLASEDPDQTLRGFCRVAVEAMAFLHSKGICHGDFTPNNILHHISGLDGHSEQEILEILGQPMTNDLLTSSGEPHATLTAPRYAVYPVDWAEVDTAYFTNVPRVNDLGEAFQYNKPPEYLGIPPPYRSPELFLEEDLSNLNGFASDLWALGCTLFEIRTGRRLFDILAFRDDDYLLAMAEILGPMPEPWWSTTWKGRKRFLKDEPDSLGHVLGIHREAVATKEPAPKNYTSTVHPSFVEDARSVRKMLTTGVWYTDMDETDEKAHRDMPEKEQEMFADLIGRLLKWQPEERLSAEEILKHEWFDW